MDLPALPPRNLPAMREGQRSVVQTMHRGDREALMPTTRKTLKAVRDALKKAIVISAKARDREREAAIRTWYAGRTEGLKAAQRLVEEMCQ